MILSEKEKKLYKTSLSRYAIYLDCRGQWKIRMVSSDLEASGISGTFDIKPRRAGLSAA